MAAAVFLHNAIFTSDPPTSSPSVTVAHHHHHHHHHHRAPNRRTPHDRQLSSVSSVTLQTSTSEHSHPTTETLIHAESSESSVYLDLLARQPTYPASPSGPPRRGLALSLEGDPITPRERRVQHERTVRRLLKRLRWAQRGFWVVIGGWATYNTVRYYLGAWLYSDRERQIIALVLGSCTALCLACNAVSVIISASVLHLGWVYRPNSKHVLLQNFLHYSSSLCLLAPAIVNFVLVFLWRNTSNTTNSLHGRCHWDIDVVWSGLGGQCITRSPAWGFWLAGALVRLILTAAVLIAYHVVSYNYTITRRPSRRRHTTSIFRHSAASFPSTSIGTTGSSSRSFRPIATVSSANVPLAASAEGHSSMASQRESGSASDHEPRALRTSRSRILAGEMSPSGSRVVRRAVSAQGLQEAARQEAGVRSVSPTSSDEGSAEDGQDRFGRAVRRTPGGYASVPLFSPSLTVGHGAAGAISSSRSWDPVPDADLNTFATHFRALVEQVTRETDEAVAYAQEQEQGQGQERFDFPASYSSADQDREDGAHVVLGRTIHRMPTIESLGSHEVMSLASAGFSRPSTRSNTLSGYGDGTHSRSASRANSLDAAMSLSVSVDGLNAVAAERGEMGELTTTTPSSATSFSGPFPFGTRSTASYHTAMSTPHEGSQEGG